MIASAAIARMPENFASDARSSSWTTLLLRGARGRSLLNDQQRHGDAGDEPRDEQSHTSERIPSLSAS